MQIIKAKTEIMDELDGAAILRKIELCGRTAYKSEDKITDESAARFVRGIIKSGHESVLEHFSFTVRFIVDRGVSHELVRHRLSSFTQESTRYVNYGKSGECTFIQPCFFEGKDPSGNSAWRAAMAKAEECYLKIVTPIEKGGLGRKPQEARSVLPNSVKTEVVMTSNLRQWRTFFELRTAADCHPQMLEVTIPLLDELKTKLPVIFDDVEVTEAARLKIFG